MYPAIVQVKPLDDYKLHLSFKNGQEGIFDMKPYLHIEIFKPLQNLEIFNSVKISFDTVEWQNEIDIDPETLYEDSVKLALA
jgi:hypothetical protein